MFFCGLWRWRPRARRLRVLTLAVTSVLAINSWSPSAIFVWNNSAGGTYGLSTNWTPAGPPGVADTARFSLANSYTVNLAANQSASFLDVIVGTPTFSP